jgi:hypothetical protein
LKRFTEGLDLVDSDLESEVSEWESDDEDKTYMEDEWDGKEWVHENDHEITEEEGQNVLNSVLKMIPGDYMEQAMKAMAKKPPKDTRDQGDYNRINYEFMSYLDKEKARNKFS